MGDLVKGSTPGNWQLGSLGQLVPGSQEMQAKGRRGIAGYNFIADGDYRVISPLGLARLIDTEWNAGRRVILLRLVGAAHVFNNTDKVFLLRLWEVITKTGRAALTYGFYRSNSAEGVDIEGVYERGAKAGQPKGKLIQSPAYTGKPPLFMYCGTDKLVFRYAPKLTWVPTVPGQKLEGPQNSLCQYYIDIEGFGPLWMDLSDIEELRQYFKATNFRFRRSIYDGRVEGLIEFTPRAMKPK